MTAIWAGRFAIAGIWLYQGLWCKVLGRVPRHREVMASSPVFGGSSKQFAILLGWWEVALACWVLSGSYARAAAITQICLLVVMNTGGLLWARRIIPDPAGMVFHNLALIVLIWMCG